MKTSVFKLFVKGFLFIVALVLVTAFHRPEASAEPVPITACGPIDQAGSYVLANNLVVAENDCLQIRAEFVTIDLAGFLIVGNGLGGGIFSRPGSSPRGIVVRNGTISGFTLGIHITGDGTIVEKVRVFGNDSGITVLGTGIVRDNIAQGNGGCGICGDVGIVTGNIARDNGSFGIRFGQGILKGNFVTNNADGIVITSEGSTVSGNTAIANNLLAGNHTGISVTCPANVIGNTATTNRGGNLVPNGQGCNNTENLAP
jgi:parallel beta-helix repeat protein